MNERRPTSSRKPRAERELTSTSRRAPPSRQESQAQRPKFSLAGNGYSQQPSYIDPRYHENNPRYGRPAYKPVWGLAKPLPRVVRRGGGGSTVAVPNRKRQGLGRPTHSNDDGTEPAPQVARVPAQRAEEHEEPSMRDDGEGTAGHIRSRTNESYHSPRNAEGRETGVSVSASSRGRGGGFRKNSRSSTSSHVNKPVIDTRPTAIGGNEASWNSMERYGSPKRELDDPFERYVVTSTDSQKFQEFGVTPANSRPESMQHRTDESGDLAAHRLSIVAEVDSTDELSKRPTMKSELDKASTDSLQLKTSSDADNVDWDLDLEAQTQQLEEDYEFECDDQDYYDTNEKEGLHNWWSPIRDRLREPLAEGLATFTFALIAISTNLSVLTSEDKAGVYMSGNWASGLGIMLGIYIAGGISGAHLNPAISIILCIFRGFPPRKTLIYVIAQCFGAFLAALVAFGIYKNAIMKLDGGVLNTSANQSGQAFLPGPAAWTSSAESWANEFVATGILACAILALGDDQNAPPGAGMHAFIVGLVVTVLGMAFGYPTGACLNPARDLGPRLAALAVGYGGQVFRSNQAWWLWGGWASTIGGAIMGSLIYDAFIFIGGESPVNYLGRKRKDKEPRERKKRFGNWWKYGSERSKVKTNTLKG